MNETGQNQQNPKHELPNSTDKKSLIEEYEDLLTNGEEELSPETQAMMEEISSDEALNKEIQDLVLAMQDGTLDLSAVQSKFLLLIRSALGRLNKEKSRAIDHRLKINEKEMAQLAMLSHHLMMQKMPGAKRATEGIAAPKDKYHNLTSAAIKSTSQIIKRFVMYEIYKILTPRRIAGESIRENLMHNYIAGGIRRALHYDASEVKHASVQTLRTLESQHMSAVRHGQIGR